MDVLHRVGHVLVFALGLFWATFTWAEGDETKQQRIDAGTPSKASTEPARTGMNEQDRKTHSSKWALTAYPYYDSSELTSDAPNPTNTNNDYSVAGGLVGAEYRFDEFFRMGLTYTHGRTDVEFTGNRIEEIDVESNALGIHIAIDDDNLEFTMGLSAAHNTIAGQLNTSSDEWDAWEWAVHMQLKGSWHISGPLWLTPQIAYRHLDLTQDAHKLVQSIPRESRTSDIIYGGMNFDIRIKMAPNRTFRPWVFTGFTYDLRDQPPTGPSVFLNQAMAGNHFTTFANDTSNVPAVFPGHLTGIFSAGVDAQISDKIHFVAAYYRRMNENLDSNMIRVGLGTEF